MVYPPTRVPWKFHAELPGMYDFDGVSDGSELAPFPNGHTAELGRGENWSRDLQSGKLGCDGLPQPAIGGFCSVSLLDNGVQRFATFATFGLLSCNKMQNKNMAQYGRIHVLFCPLAA